MEGSSALRAVGAAPAGWSRRALLGASLLVVASWSSPAGGASGLTRALQRERSALGELEALTREALRQREELDDLEYRGRQLGYRLSEAQRRLDALAERIDRRREHLRLRLRALYKLSRGSLVRLLLQAEDSSELPRSARALTRVLTRDIEELQLHKAEVRRLRDERQRLQHQRAKQRQLLVKMRDRQRALRGAREAQRRLLRRLHFDRRWRARLAGELSERQQRLLQAIRALGYRVRRGGGLFAGLRGRLRKPTPGPIAARFGQGVDPRTGLKLSRSGVTILTWPRAPVRAVANGTVRLVRQLEGYGKVVLVDHGDGYYTLSGFLGRTDVETGERVRAGAILGRAGEDPLSGRPAVHFEIRHRSRALDPAEWFKR